MRFFSPREEKLQKLAQNILKELVARFPHSENVDEAANWLASLELRDEASLSTLARKVRDILYGADNYKMEFEDHIRRRIEEQPELVYPHFAAWLRSSPQDYHLFLLFQAVIFEALRQGSKRVGDWIKENWRVRRLYLCIEEPEPQDILGGVAFKILEEEYPVEELSLILGQSWESIPEEPFLKLVTRRIFEMFKNQLRESETVQRNRLRELFPEYWLQAFEEFFSQQGIPLTISEVAQALPQNRKMILSIGIYSIENDEIKNLEAFICNANRLSVQLWGKKIVEMRDSPNAFYEAYDDAVNEGILWGVEKLTITNLEWLSQNVGREEVEHPVVRETILALPKIRSAGGLREQRKKVRELAHQVWQNGQAFSLGPLSQLRGKWDKYVIWLGEIVFQERKRYERKIF